MKECLKIDENSGETIVYFQKYLNNSYIPQKRMATCAIASLSIAFNAKIRSIFEKEREREREKGKRKNSLRECLVNEDLFVESGLWEKFVKNGIKANEIVKGGATLTQVECIFSFLRPPLLFGCARASCA